MTKLNSQALYKVRTGRSWISDVERSGELQQEAVEAQARYMDAFGDSTEEEEQALLKDMKEKFEKSMLYWQRMLEDLRAC